jgi:excisionase family DNA binding protein
MNDRWLSVDEVGEYLGVSKDTVYAWVTNKGMPGYKVGRFWKFKREDVDGWVRAGGAASGSDEALKEKPGDGRKEKIVDDDLPRIAEAYRELREANPEPGA